MEYKIKLEKPARDFNEGFLLGNGHTGAVVYGGIQKEVIELSEITFYSGEVSQENNQKNASEAFKTMRKLVSEGEYEASMEAARGFMGIRRNYGTNLPVGKLIIELPDGEVTGYNRELNLMAGIAAISYTQKGVDITRETFVSNPSKKLFYKIQSKETGFLCARIFFEGMNDNVWVDCQEGEYTFMARARESLHSDGTCGVSLLGRVSAGITGGTIEYTKNGILIEGAESISFTLALSTDFETSSDNQNKIPLYSPSTNEFLQEQNLLMRGRGFDFDMEKEKHSKDFSAFMRRVDIDLPEDFVTGLMFQYGRYLLLSSSREDSPLPAHLQGIWNDNVACNIGWTCDMHLDINTQMNYWIAGPANLSECDAPLFHWMEKKVIPSGRITAKESYGLQGWSADLVSNAWGFTAPYWSRNISPCPTGGIWAADAYLDYYEYTGEVEFLINRAYPVFEEAAEFFTKYVFKDKESNYYTAGPSISPENSFEVQGTSFYFSNGCTYELTVIRQLFTNFLNMAGELKKDTPLVQKVKEILPKLLPFRILKDNTLAEWNHDYPAKDSQHRHTSHLLGLYPYSQITVEETPELAQAVKNTLTNKLFPYENWEDTGWARSMLLLYASRLQEGEEAYFHIKEIQEKLTHPNYLVMHPPTRGAGSFKEVYELDGNTGFTMGVLEMLLQSHDGKIRLLPALPRAWSKGSIQGIVARGAVTVSITWENYRMKEAAFLSKYDKEIRIEYSMGKAIKREKPARTEQRYSLKAGIWLRLREQEGVLQQSV
ncbi:hypothetical protein acsn021_08310 [Anaerocolumna cellulosilytica]|uniref:Uncharacterized protein n=1 Tax=Anaerocolumna cellulosilytica TaxID=433286 RepID=A0A6S6R138_9FIRM|nr:glycoside hydrolase family 95 protein [Anaerocolumna cellulosilytica]MBB5194319.1 alpha-L-fucosidase 2 [Anaerocolumna cellulosilytica]BCJ93262.1 hypothetical protein acsn021_08310 [Anaerocolumna cellulosilytica]